MNKKINILFIGHDASRTGAPLVLLNYLKWLKKHHPEYDLSLILLRKGELAQKYIDVVDHFIEIPTRTLISKVRRKLLNHSPKNEYLKFLDIDKYQLIYANTVESCNLAVAIKQKNRSLRIISHLHELNVTLKLLEPQFTEYTKEIDQFICPSKLVADNLRSNYKVEKDKVSVIYEFIEKPKWYSPKKRNEGIFRVGASGTFHWRKGGDLFLQLIRNIHSKYPQYSIEFVWIGRVPKVERMIIEADLAKLGLNDKICFTGLLENPQKEYEKLDVFVLPSREDPFPLVCIEVAMMGIPIICFENATGTSEVLMKGGGHIVPYLDTQKMAEKIIEYYEDEELKIEHGKINKENFSEFTVENMCPQILKKMQRLLELKH